MIIIWGSYHVGTTDVVPGMFRVATRFGHLWYLPLIPMGTTLLLDGEEDGEGNPPGMAIPFSFKSAILGWARAGTLLTGIVVMGIGLFAGPRGVDGLRLLEGAASLGACLWLTYGKAFRRASYARAQELGDLLGLTEQGRILLDLACEEITPEEAEQRMAAIVPVEEAPPPAGGGSPDLPEL